MAVKPPPRLPASAARSPKPRASASVTRRAKATLRHLRFSSGTRIGNLLLSADLKPRQRRMIADWIYRLAPGLLKRLPPIKIAVAQRLMAVRRGVFIDDDPGDHANRRREYTHAVSFI